MRAQGAAPEGGTSARGLSSGNGSEFTTNAAVRGTAPGAASAFVAGLPQMRRGRLITAASEVDSHRHKPAVIAARIALDAELSRLFRDHCDRKRRERMRSARRPQVGAP